MARSIRVPFLVDVTFVDDPAAIDGFESDSRVDRTYGAHGPWYNRLLQRRLGSEVNVDSERLPAFRPRDDAERIETQKALTKRLQAITVDQLAKDPDVDAIARWVRESKTDDPADVGPMVQQFTGRLFDPEYIGDAESYEAANTVDGYLRSGPLRGAWMTYKGKVKWAVHVLSSRAGGDAHAVHATAIAFHNMVVAVSRMRTIAQTPGRDGRASEATIAEQCLVPPETALRTVSEPVQTVQRRNPLKPGALIVYRLADAFGERADVAATFRSGAWSQCPAHGLVPNFLRAVWRQAAAGDAS